MSVKIWICDLNQHAVMFWFKGSQDNDSNGRNWTCRVKHPMEHYIVMGGSDFPSLKYNAWIKIY